MCKWTTALAIVAILIYIPWTNHRGEKARRHFQDNLAQRGLPATIDQWRKERDGDFDSETIKHATDFFKAAMTHPDPHGDWAKKLPFINVADDPKPTEAIDRELSQALDLFMQDQTSCFALVDRARTYERFDYRIRTDGRDREGIRLLGGMRRVARKLQLATLHAEVHGDGEAAVANIDRMLALVTSFDDEPLTVTGLVQMSVDMLLVSVLEGMLSRLEPEVETLQQLKARLQKRTDKWHDRYMAVLASELVSIAEQADSFTLIEGEIERYKFIKQHFNPHNEFWSKEAFRLVYPDLPPWMTLPIQRGILSWTTICPGWAQLRWLRDGPEKLAFYDRVLRLGQDWPALARLAVEVAYEPHDELSALYLNLRTTAENLGYLRAAIAALHVETYRRQHGRWPTGPDELGDAWPPDPMDGQPIRYRATEYGVMVYSIGRNLHDDGGYGRPGSRNQHPDGRDARDVIFRLYNPELRNRRPPQN